MRPPPPLLLHRLLTAAVGLLFPYVQAILGPRTFFLFAGACATASLFAMCLVPETKGTAREEMDGAVAGRSSR